MRIHRAVPAQDYTFAATVVDTAPERSTDYYYVRLAARNGQLAWDDAHLGRYIASGSTFLH